MVVFCVWMRMVMYEFEVPRYLRSWEKLCQYGMAYILPSAQIVPPPAPGWQLPT